MKIVVIGGTGLIGSKVVANLAAHGHDAVPASPTPAPGWRKDGLWPTP